jgi:hypothetical protein
MLVALLRFGLSDESAIGFGWWCEPELPELKRQAFRTNRRNVGKLIEMTTDELVEHELWHLGVPVDQTAEEFKAWKKTRAKELAAKRKQQQRDNLREEKERQMLKLAKVRRNPRDVTVFKILVENGKPMSVAELMEAVRKLYDFHHVRSEAALRKAVHRVINRLKAKDEILTDKRPGPTGERWVFIPRFDYSTMSPGKTRQACKINNLSKNTPVTLLVGSQGRDKVSDIPSNTHQSNVLPFRAAPTSAMVAA